VMTETDMATGTWTEVDEVTVGMVVVVAVAVVQKGVLAELA